MKRIHLDFSGYWRDVNRAGIPAAAGVYCVYRCKYDGVEKTITPLQLLYVGESVDVRKAVAQRTDLRQRWEEYLNPREELCFSFSPIILHRRWAEAALSHAHLPAVNLDLGMPGYLYDDTELVLSGRIGLLSSSFVVKHETELVEQRSVPGTDDRAAQLSA